MLVALSTSKETYRRSYTENLDAVAVTETFLSEGVLDSELVDVSAFTVSTRDRNRCGGGGSAMAY